MSATNRQPGVRARDDYYITPQKTISEFLAPFYSQVGHEFELSGKIEILDPCAGGDAKYGMAYPEVLNKEWIDTSITTVDIRQDSRADIKESFLDWKADEEYDLVVSNPPYNLALEFIKKGLEVVRDGGYVAYLLRLNFFGSQKRRDFFKAFMPEYCFIHSDRPCFLTKEIIADLKKKVKEDAAAEEEKILKETGKVVKIKPKSVSTTDATEYAHFVWRKGYNPQFCKTIVV
jgi:hypothetical protein